MRGVALVTGSLQNVASVRICIVIREDAEIGMPLLTLSQSNYCKHSL